MSPIHCNDLSSKWSTSQDGIPYKISLNDIHSQNQCAIFQLPAEIRQNIYRYVFASYEDLTRTYNKNTYWYRPQSKAPWITATSFLQACKRVYAEAQDLPWLLMSPSIWLAAPSRAPPKRLIQTVTDDLKFAQRLLTKYQQGGNTEIEHVRFFAQLYMLEPGQKLTEHLSIPHFRPRTITVVLRHTDWWYWEHDHPLRIDATWVNTCRFPTSVNEIKLELESLERKRPQVDSIAEQMKATWFFTRTDDVQLSATTTTVDIMRWQGISRFGNSRRWLRDEVEPYHLNYYVATVTFRREVLDKPLNLPKPAKIFNEAIQPVIKQSIPPPDRAGFSTNASGAANQSVAPVPFDVNTDPPALGTASMDSRWVPDAD